jgi:hypothetical protein
MTYEEILARAPRSTQAGDTQAAAEFATFLSFALQDRVASPITENQRTYLYKLRTRWQTRTEGRDARWNIAGSRPGRPPGAKNKVSRRVRPDPGEKTPLFQSLMRKYGTPRNEA